MSPSYINDNFLISHFSYCAVISLLINIKVGKYVLFYLPPSYNTGATRNFSAQEKFGIRALQLRFHVPQLKERPCREKSWCISRRYSKNSILYEGISIIRALFSIFKKGWERLPQPNACCTPVISTNLLKIIF